MKSCNMNSPQSLQHFNKHSYSTIMFIILIITCVLFPTSNSYLQRIGKKQNCQNNIQNIQNYQNIISHNPSFVGGSGHMDSWSSLHVSIANLDGKRHPTSSVIT